jgi:hypothetical protein
MTGTFVSETRPASTGMDTVRSVTTSYTVEVLQVDREDWLDELRRAVAQELQLIGLHRSLTIIVSESPDQFDGPGLTVFLGSEAAATDIGLVERLDNAVERARLVIPVVDQLGHYASHVSPILRSINGLEWDPERLARFIIEELGIEEAARRVFISHKRDDGLGAAETLHDELIRAGFSAFIDRFAIRKAEEVQPAIADALEDYAFLLLLETPLAATSDWVFDEVDYALSHAMGMLIVRWPGNPPEVPGSHGLPRLELSEAEITTDEHGYDVPTPAALNRLVAEIERSHAAAMVRRRRMLVGSIEEAAEFAGCGTRLSLPGWRMLIEKGKERTIVATTPRLPTASDLQRLDEARNSMDESAEALLVHSARRIPAETKTHLDWVSATRRLSRTPENGVGAWWTS